MVNKKQVLTKIKAMAKEHNKALLKECERLLNCGGVDVDSYENDLRLPKVILQVAAYNINFIFDVNSEAKKDVENLKHF